MSENEIPDLIDMPLAEALAIESAGIVGMTISEALTYLRGRLGWVFVSDGDRCGTLNFRRSADPRVIEADASWNDVKIIARLVCCPDGVDVWAKPSVTMLSEA